MQSLGIVHLSAMREDILMKWQEWRLGCESNDHGIIVGSSMSYNRQAARSHKTEACREPSCEETKLGMKKAARRLAAFVHAFLCTSSPFSAAMAAFCHCLRMQML